MRQKFLPVRLRKLYKRIAIECHVQRHRIDPTFVIEALSKQWNFFLESDLHYDQLTFRHCNCEWIFRVPFGMDVYRQQLLTRFDKCVSLLRSLERCSANLTSKARSPFYARNVVGGVDMNCDLVAKLKIAKKFPVVLVGDS